MHKITLMWAVFAVFLLLALPACSAWPAAQPAPEETQILTLPEVSSPNPQSYPPAGQPSNPPAGEAYPPAAQPAAGQDSLAYPELTDGSEISWDQALGLLRSGQVTRVSQRHDLTVALTLQDGRTLQTLEPEIDAILKEIETCGDFCRNIRVATE